MSAKNNAVESNGEMEGFDFIKSNALSFDVKNHTPVTGFATCGLFELNEITTCSIIFPSALIRWSF